MSAGQLERTFALASLRAFCDVVFVDQRGFSERGDILRATFQPPVRRADQPLKPDAAVAAFEAFARQTVAEFANAQCRTCAATR